MFKITKSHRNAIIIILSCAFSLNLIDLDNAFATTYYNDRFGFSLDYPDNFIYEESKGPINEDFPWAVFFYSEESDDTFTMWARPDYAIVTTTAAKDSLDSSDNEYFSILEEMVADSCYRDFSIQDGQCKKVTIEELKKLAIDGFIAYQIQYSWKNSDSGIMTGAAETFTIIPENQFIWKISNKVFFNADSEEIDSKLELLESYTTSFKRDKTKHLTDEDIVQAYKNAPDFYENLGFSIASLVVMLVVGKILTRYTSVAWFEIFLSGLPFISIPLVNAVLPNVQVEGIKVDTFVPIFPFILAIAIPLSLKNIRYNGRGRISIPILIGVIILIASIVLSNIVIPSIQDRPSAILERLPIEFVEYLQLHKEIIFGLAALLFIVHFVLPLIISRTKEFQISTRLTILCLIVGYALSFTSLATAEIFTYNLSYPVGVIISTIIQIIFVVLLVRREEQKYLLNKQRLV